jgi:ADP-ribose pyrophosphatase YjhB (NUDIX family)
MDNETEGPVSSSGSPESMVQAAGGLLWRHAAEGYEIAVIYRNRYGDWTLPKGKLNEGESWEEGALREVREETGYNASIARFAGAIAYTVKEGPKEVRFWHMLAIGRSSSVIDSEVAEVRWLPIEKARQQVQYPLERALLEVWQGPEEVPMEQSSDSNAAKTKRRRSKGSSSLARLRNSLPEFAVQLETRIRTWQGKHANEECWWGKDAQTLLRDAKAAVGEGDTDLGWRCFKAAVREAFHGLEDSALRAEAQAVLNEAFDDKKRVTKWRRDGIGALLKDDKCLKNPVDVEEVIAARRLLDEHFDNQYHKLSILRDRLSGLTITGAVTLLAWLVLSPALSLAPPCSSVLGSIRADWLKEAIFWLVIVLGGVLGATLSGFISTIGANLRESRIPEELSTSTVTFARLCSGAVSAVAVCVFALSGILIFAKVTCELLLAIAVVSGFSEQLLLRGIQKASNPA